MTTPSDIPASDQDLVAWVREGDTDSFDRLVRRHHRPVYGLIVHLLHDPDLADDMTQDVFVKAYRELESLRAEDSFSRWILRIANNHALDHLRREQSLMRRGLDTIPLDPTPDTSNPREGLLSDQMAVICCARSRGRPYYSTLETETIIAVGVSFPTCQVCRREMKPSRVRVAPAKPHLLTRTSENCGLRSATEVNGRAWGADRHTRATPRPPSGDRPGYVSAVLGRGGGGAGLPASGRSAWPRASWRGASQVVEDAVDDLWLGDECDYAHLFAAAGTR